MVFMFIWIFYFAFAYYILGNEIEAGDDFSYLLPKDQWPQNDADLNEVGAEYSNLNKVW